MAILVWVELAGFVGALLALPVAGIIQIVVLDVLETSGHPIVSEQDALFHRGESPEEKMEQPGRSRPRIPP